MLYAALLTPVLALPALLLMDRLDRWVAGADPPPAGDGRVGAHPKPARPPVGGRVRVTPWAAVSVTGTKAPVTQS